MVKHASSDAANLDSNAISTVVLSSSDVAMAADASATADVFPCFVKRLFGICFQICTRLQSFYLHRFSGDWHLLSCSLDKRQAYS